MPAVCVITAVEMATHWPPSSKARQGVQLVCGLGGGGWLGEASTPGKRQLHSFKYRQTLGYAVFYGGKKAGESGVGSRLCWRGKKIFGAGETHFRFVPKMPPSPG